MKISFGEDLKRQDSGKHKFLRRLSTELESMGVRTVSGKSDIFLHIGRNMDKGRAKRKIMRIDGLILNSDQPYNKMNKKILRNIHSSDAVVYQGQFCKDAFERFLGVKKTHACIHNGADPKEFLERDPQNFFLSCCHWRPHKRLKNVCSGFVKALDKGLDADLLIAGDTKEEVKHPRIKYLGWQKPKKLRDLLSKAIATIHISWLDWCPNAMIESVVAGCPVIYSSSGGSPEIGERAGIEVADIAWDFKPCQLYKPPKISDDVLANAMIELKQKKLLVKRDDLHIRYVAEAYLKFFGRVLS
jgi:glycosyltransferase involved in cell wall biosynthesis